MESIIVIKFKEEGVLDEKDWETQKDSIKSYLLRMKEERYFISWLEGAKANMISEGKLKILKNVEDL